MFADDLLPKFHYTLNWNISFYLNSYINFVFLFNHTTVLTSSYTLKNLCGNYEFIAYTYFEILNDLNLNLETSENWISLI